MSYGPPQTIACTLISTLQKVVHHIKTRIGRPIPVYGDADIPISGLGQCNGMGPTVWALIHSKSLLMMHTAGHGVWVTSASALTNIIISQWFHYSNHNNYQEYMLLSSWIRNCSSVPQCKIITLTVEKPRGSRPPSTTNTSSY